MFFGSIINNIKSFFTKFDFKVGTSLAGRQDKIFAQYKAGQKIDEETIKSFEFDAWFLAAKNVCPGNLVIRNYCLLDIFKNKPLNAKNIIEQMNILTYNGNGKYRMWAEGYSYWLYTKAILNDWVSKFNIQEAIDIRAKIDDGFVQTSYLRNGVWYPAPYGDLRDTPMEIQANHEKKDINIDFVTFENIGEGKYRIAGKPIKLNLHTPNDDRVIDIINGKPQGFVWYTGYSSKYGDNKINEIKDVIDRVT